MDDSLSTEEELVALRQRLAELVALAHETHTCGEGLPVRRRTFAGGATHYVRQCTVCGQQRGGPLAKRDVQQLLLGTQVEPFDEDAEDRRRQASMTRHEEKQRLARRLTELENPEVARVMAEEQAKHEAQIKRISDGIADAVAASSVMPANHRESYLIAEVLKHRGTYSEPPDSSSQPFASEAEVTAWLDGWVEQDFDVWREVTGTHLAEKTQVRVDYVLRPKPHLVAAGFMPCFLGVEAKYLPTDGGFSPKASRAVRQAMSYMDSVFDLEGQQIRLHRLLLFTNMSFESERHALRGIERYALSNDKAKWAALLELANHANVGNLEIYGGREGWKGWRIAFATGKYFSRYLKEYRLADVNLFAKVRVGNF